MIANAISSHIGLLRLIFVLRDVAFVLAERSAIEALAFIMHATERVVAERL